MAEKTYHILHVEDVEDRFRNYKLMVDAALDEAQLPHEVHWAKTIPEAVNYIVSYPNNLDLILLDITLGDGNEGTGLNLLEKIRSFLHSTIPVFIVSSNVDRYENVLEKLKQEQAIAGYSDPINDVWAKKLCSILGRREVSLLHLADIHKGKFFGLDGLVLPEQRIINNLCAQLGKIDFVVVSGDLSSINDEKDYRNALQLLDTLKVKLGLSASNFIFTPGNHDRDRNRTDSYIFSKFLTFIQLFYGREGVQPDDYRYPDETIQDYDNPQTVFDHLFSIALFDEYKTIIVGFNSVNPVDTAANDTIRCGLQGDTKCGFIYGGKISSEQIENVRLALDSIFKSHPETRDYVKIAAFHHNIFEPSHVQALDWCPTLVNEGNLLAFLSDFKFRFILHGHLHYAENYYYRICSKPCGINIVSTGTLGGKHRDLDARFCANKITYFVDRNGNLTDPQLHRFTIPPNDIHWQKTTETLMI